MEYLLSDRKIARATHNIMAYRFKPSESGVVHQGPFDMYLSPRSSETLTERDLWNR
jgi:hypothetical protein